MLSKLRPTYCASGFFPYICREVKQQTPVTMNTSADFKLIDKAKRNADRIAAHLNVPTLWVSVMYADGGFVYVRTIDNNRQYGIKMRGAQVSRSFPIV